MTRRTTRWFLLLFLMVFLPFGKAHAEQDVDGIEDLLPHYETEAERLIWLGREHEMPGRDLVSDPPPAGPLRNCAEWEPCTGVLIRYPLGLPYQLLRDFDDQVNLHVIVSSSLLSTAQANLTANGVDMDRVEFLVKPNDSIWTRDYGPWFVFAGDGNIVIINHTYNRPWRPNDNLIPLYFGQQQGIPVISHDMYHTGGNYMTDGAHISSSTRLVYDEAWSNNGMTESEVDQLMYDYYGVETYHVLEYIESGGIHHIDTWAKFLDEETVLVKEVWPTHWTSETLEDRATLVASLEASTGRNYRVHRVYCYNIGNNYPASYTNSLVLNNHIYVPLFGNSTYDNQALATYQTAATGYEVQGYLYSGWLTDDALHCRAKGMMDRGMLRVGHIPVTEVGTGNVTITAYIKAHSGSELTRIDLHYRRDGGEWIAVPMAPAAPDSYSATIPSPARSRITTDYFIQATDASGRSAGMPRVAPAHWYSFTQAVTDVADAAPDSPVVMYGNRPNPFNPQTTFRFELRRSTTVELTVSDVRGRNVRHLINGTMPAGMNEVAWDGRDDAGRKLPSGVYYFRLHALGLRYSRAATLVK